MHTFSRSIFSIGIPIMKKSIDIPTKDFTIQFDVTYRKSEGKFRFSPDNKVYFLSQIFWFKFFRFNTPFPFKAIGTIRPDNKIDIVARLPIGSSLFLLFWLIGWTVAAIRAGVQFGKIGAMGFGLIGWIFAAIMIGISYPIEKNRMETMIDELKSIMTRHNRI